VTPAIDPGPFPSEPVAIARECGAEIVTGLFLGLLVRLFVLALQTAGAIAAQSTSLSQLFGGTAGADPQPAMANLLVVGGLAVAMMLGLHVKTAAYLIHSYSALPVGAVLSPQRVVTLGITQISATFGLAYSIAAPFLIASLVYNVALGVINRAMPQLMVAFVGAPAITAGGLLLFLAASPIMISVWHGAMTGFLSSFGADTP
jgi:flagellar biosynthetic protein FliR